ncbi:MAG: alpha/beta fold hydrolase [Bacteroidota bacterium]
MKGVYMLMLFCVTACEIKAQDISGRWYSKTILEKEEFHFLLDIRTTENTFWGYIDLPAQNTFRMPLDSVSYSNSGEVVLMHRGLALSFRGKFDQDRHEMEGVVEKDGYANSLVLSRHPQVNRTQMIEEPIPYLSKDVYFYNKDSTKLAGTITFPKEGQPTKAVVLISGSGPQNRDEEILGHQPFKILADHLTRQGIVVLRYDDRGYGASEGKFRPATSLDYAYDALAAVQYLKHFDGGPIEKIGLIGHSEGGNIAPLVATLDTAVNFLVLLAAPGTSNFESYLVSLDLILKAYPETYDRDFPFFKSVYEDMATIDDKKTLRDSLTSKFQFIASVMDSEELSIYGGADQYITSQVNYHCSDWYHYYLQFDVTPYLQQLKIPILALNGDQDHSVEATFNLNGIEKTLKAAGHPQYEVVELENVNHFFQGSEDAKIESVYFNEETFSKVALKKIEQWIKKL